MQREKKTTRRQATRPAAGCEVDPAALPDAPEAALDADPVAPVPEAPLVAAPVGPDGHEAGADKGQAGGRGDLSGSEVQPEVPACGKEACPGVCASGEEPGGRDADGCEGAAACAHDNEVDGQGRPAAGEPDGTPGGQDGDAACEQDAQAVAQAQDGLAGRWARLGEGVFDPDALDPEILDEEGDLGRFDVHDPHQLGELGEHLAARYLRGYGYTILERNYRCEFGEADLICTKDDCVVLVEVKTRLGGEAMPEEAVTAQKLKRYRRITLAYLMSHEWFDSVRLDVLAINIAKPRRAQVHHFMGVCEWEG